VASITFRRWAKWTATAISKDIGRTLLRQAITLLRQAMTLWRQAITLLRQAMTLGRNGGR